MTSRRGRKKAQEEERAQAAFICNNCNRPLTGMHRIRCCTCQNFDLCVDCFAAGAEPWPHMNTHPYKVFVRFHTEFVISLCYFSIQGRA